MRAPLSREEISRHLPKPGSVLRRRVSDPRALLGAAGYALTLQVAHPTIAGGVRDHSTYATDPWGRAFRTADYVFLLSYGDADTVFALAKGLHAMHRTINGTDPSGRRYDAFEPGAYAWVHASIADSIVRGHELLGSALDAREREAFWSDWLELGDIIGVDRAELPATFAGFDAYLAHMVDHVLEDNDVVRSLFLASHRAVGGSPLRWIPSSAFGLVGRPLGHFMRFLGIGMLPPRLRERFGFAWTRAQEAAFVAYCKASKASGPVLPRPLREMGPLTLRLRRNEVGPFGRRRPAASCP